MLEEITGMISFILSPLTVFPPYIAVALLSVILTLLILGLNRVFTDREAVKELKARMSEIRENLTKAQKEGDEVKVNRFLNELIKVNNEYMKQTFKVLIVSLIIAAIFLPWLSVKYSGLAVAYLPFNLPLIGNRLNGIYWYIFISLVVGWLVNRLFGV